MNEEKDPIDNETDSVHEEHEAGQQRTIIIDPKQQPLRIDKFLMDRLPRVSRSRVQDAIREGEVLVNGKPIKPNFKIKPGFEITFQMPYASNEKRPLKPQNIPLDIVYEDDAILILNKPPGLVVHPGIGNWDGTLVNGLAYHFNSLPVLAGNDPDRVGLVHRIDKFTSGLLVIAKTDEAMTHLAKQFFDHTIERTYQAIVWGEPDPAEGTITKSVGRHPRFRDRHTTFPDDEDKGKHAITHYRVIEPLYYVSLVECRLETGRTHQIRVHMKSIGHPLFNDIRYGGDQIHKGTVFSKYKSFVENTFKVLPRQGLHAKSLGFIHPVTEEKMHFDSELPDDMQAALDRWRKYVHHRREA